MTRTWRPVALLYALALTAALAAGHPARAQEPAAPQGAPTVEELEATIATLEDAEARQRLVAELRALIAAQRASEAQAEEPPLVGNLVLRVLSERMVAVREAVAEIATATDDPGRLGRWLVTQVEEPERRALWLESLVQALLAVALGLGAGKLTGLALRRSRERIEAREPAGPWRRAPLLAARTALDILQILAFAAAAYAVLTIVQPADHARLVMLSAINAIVIARSSIVAARLLLTPLAPSLRLVTLSDTGAAYAFVWVRRLINIPVYGYYAGQAALALGLPGAGYALYSKLLGLLITAMLLTLVMQNRGAVAGAIRGGDAPAGRRGPSLGALRRPLADIWHLLAILYLAMSYGVWALEIEDGFAFIARGSLATVVALAAARLLVELIRYGVSHAFQVSAEIRTRFPTIEQRANLYLAIGRRCLEWVVWLLAALVVLQAWRIDALGWLGSEAGRTLLGNLFEIAIVLVVTVIVWEGSSAAVVRFLEAKEEDGSVVERSQRLRTLLPLARNALLATLLVISALTILSTLGIEIGPLLAGAGVVGLAIGFGAQTLVKDVITGAFILFEDSIAVGDFVEVGGLSGIVEGLTVRTIRLRDIHGTVNTIPFSSVDTITNMTKDFAYYVAEVGVAYREDTDEVAAVLREVGEDLGRDPDYGPLILEPIEIMGVDRFDDSAVVIRARLKTVPGMQWRVKREFNRRVKYAFDARGIEIPFPHSTIYFGVDKDGTAPPLHVRSAPAHEAPDGEGGAATPNKGDSDDGGAPVPGDSDDGGNS